MAWSHGISGAIVGGDLLYSDRVTACTLQCVAKAMAWGGIVEVVLIGLATAYFKIYVHSTGLTLYNLWGKYYDIKWEDIKSARAVNFSGLRYILINSNSVSVTLWLPLFLADQARFSCLVTQQLDVSNPLVKFFPIESG